MNKKQKKMLKRIISSTILTILLTILPIDEKIKNILLLIPYFIIGYDILIKAAYGILNRQVLDENFLMAIATVGAILLSESLEGVFVMLFYQIGELFQSYAVGKSRKSISELMDIRPDYAFVEDDDKNIIQKDPYDVEIGSIIVIKPGEKIPIDAYITEGESRINTSALTGESVYRSVKSGDEVLSGCINITGVLRAKTTKRFEESTASKILDLVENASSKKSRSENFISKFARVYTPVVCILSLMLAVAVPLFNILILKTNPLWQMWIYRALTFLVISCPCALVISIPLSFFAGIGKASDLGILIKGSNYIETLSKVKYVVFDKTGTLTKGTFEVSGIHNYQIEKDKLMEFASLCEAYSNHPIAKSILNAYSKDIDKTRVSDIEEISGKGVVCRIDNKFNVAVGNAKLMDTLGIEYEKSNDIATNVYVSVDNQYKGYILISDVIKDESYDAIKNLKKTGIKKTIMLTGDLESYAKDIKDKLNIDMYFSNLLPQDKVEKLEQLLDKKETNEKLAFVGDGINDAPSLTRADIGISMGAIGQDAAIEASDVVLMNDNPTLIAKAITLSKKCISIVYQNIYFAIGIKIICLILGALGILNMWFAIFADVGVMVIAVLNAIKILYIKKL